MEVEAKQKLEAGVEVVEVEQASSSGPNLVHFSYFYASITTQASKTHKNSFKDKREFLLLS